MVNNSNKFCLCGILNYPFRYIEKVFGNGNCNGKWGFNLNFASYFRRNPHKKFIRSWRKLFTTFCPPLFSRKNFQTTHDYDKIVQKKLSNALARTWIINLQSPSTEKAQTDSLLTQEKFNWSKMNNLSYNNTTRKFPAFSALL